MKGLEAKISHKYGKLTQDEIKTLVVDDKWLAVLLPMSRVNWIACPRHSPGASGNWLNATPHRCQRSLKRSKPYLRVWMITSRRWGRYGSEARV